MKLRKLNEKGLSEFTNFVLALRSGKSQTIPKWLLESEESSDAIVYDLSVDDRGFRNRYELGAYLVQLFNGHDITRYIGDIGFWSWFALYWFEQLCPEIDGVRKPSKEYNYVLSKLYNHRPRHAIYISWQLVSRYGEQAKVLLCKELPKRGEITEQFMTRQQVLSSKGVIELANDLYYDPEKENFKRGAASKGAGSARRFIAWLQQIQLTYDIFSASAEDLKRLLPKEFNRFTST